MDGWMDGLLHPFSAREIDGVLIGPFLIVLVASYVENLVVRRTRAAAPVG